MVPGLSVPTINRETTHSEKFHDVWHKAKTGDLFFVSGAVDLDGGSALATKIGSGSAFSHVGLIIRDPTEKMWAQYGKLRAPAEVAGGSGAWNQGEEVPRDKQVYLWDSDWEEDGTVDGPALRPLQEVMSEYLADDYHGTDTNCIIRFLQVDDTRRAEIKAKIEDFSLEMAGKAYEAKTLDLAHIKDGSFPQLAKCLWGLSKAEDLDRLFCSELVAAAYRAAGLLGPEINATNYAPGHFDDRRMTDGSLLGGATLSPETRIEDEEMLYRIHVTILDVRQIEDRAWYDKADPYVVVKFHGRYRWKTHVMKDNNNPGFNVGFEAWYDGESPIEFEVWDKNHMRKDTLLASGSLPSACVIGQGGKADSDPVEAPCTTFSDIVELTQEFAEDNAPMRIRIQILQVPIEEMDKGKEMVKRKKSAKRAKKALIAAQSKKMFRAPGCISGGGDLYDKPIQMTLDRAVMQASLLPGCKGFCYQVPPEIDATEEHQLVKMPLNIYFKNKIDNVQVPGWQTMGFEEDRKTMKHEFVEASSTAGQNLQFLVFKQNKWYDCTVVGGDGEGGLNVDIGGSKARCMANRCATNLRPLFTKGQHAKYHSDVAGGWLNCVIQDVKLGEHADEGGIEVGIQSSGDGWWTRTVDNMDVVTHLKPEDQGERAFGYGQDVEVKRSSGEWVAAVVHIVKENLNLVVKMKDGAGEKEIPNAGLNAFLRHAPGTGGGGGYNATVVPTLKSGATQNCA